jgi:hypothetical protein
LRLHSAEVALFPIGDAKLSFLAIANYWSREIQPPASRNELLGVLESAFWRGEIRGNFRWSRLEFFKGMCRPLQNRDDLGIVFIVGEDADKSRVEELPDGAALADPRPRIHLPSGDMATWDESTCSDAFATLAETSSTQSYPDLTPIFASIELSYEEFTRWLEKRGYTRPGFWAIAPQKRHRARTPEYSWPGVKEKLIDYVRKHGPLQSFGKLLEKTREFATELHPEGNEPSDKTVRAAIKKYDLAAVGLAPGK